MNTGFCKLKDRIFFEKTILILIFIVFVCDYNTKFTAIKNIAQYGCFVISLVYLYFFRDICLRNLKTNISNNKFLIYISFIFFIYACVVSAFSYTGGSQSFIQLIRDFKTYIIIFFILFCWYEGDENKSKWIFYALIVAYILVTFVFMYDFLNIDFKALEKNAKYRIIQREYANYSDILFAFAFVGFFIIKSKSIKIIILTFIIFGLIMDVMTGARGSWLATIISIGLCCILLYKEGYAGIIKRNKKKVYVVFLLLTIAIGFYAYYSKQFQYKITQTNSSSRDLIISDRFPLLQNSPRVWFGLGHDDPQYNAFLMDEFKKGAKISRLVRLDKEGNITEWLHDEPTFLGKIYHYGYIGTAMMFLILINMMVVSFKRYFLQKNPYYLALFTSLLSFYVIRGLFETNSIDHLFYCVSFMSVFMKYKTGDKPG